MKTLRFAGLLAVSLQFTLAGSMLAQTAAPVSAATDAAATQSTALVPASDIVAAAPADVKDTTPVPAQDAGASAAGVPTAPTQPTAKEPMVPLIGKDGNLLTGPDGSPIMVPESSVKHGLFSKKQKLPKMTPVSISRGTYTVDGLIAKAGMNYEIADLKFLYMSVPGLGTVIVSNVYYPNAKAQAKAFDGQTLTVKVDGHKLELFSDKRLLPSKKPEEAWVTVDKSFTYPSASPVLGYGNGSASPYLWPGSKENKVLKSGVAAPPPVPVSLRPKMLQKPCPIVIAKQTSGTAKVPAVPCVNPPAETPAPQPEAETASSPSSN